jgi:AmiR/NasT family two-component response regulator
MAATVGELLARDAAETRRSDVVLLDLQLKDGSAPAQNIARLKAAEYPVVIYTDSFYDRVCEGAISDALIKLLSG